MGIVFRQSVKAVLAVFGGAVLGALITFFAPKFIPQNQLGYRNSLIVQGAVLQFFVLFGLQHTLQTFLPRYATTDERRKILFSTGLIATTVVCIVLSIPYFMCQNLIMAHYQMQDRPLLSRFYFLLPILTYLWSLISLLDAFLIAEMKQALSSFIREVVLRIANIALIILFAVNLISFDAFIIGTALVYIIPLVFLWMVARRIKGWGISTKWHKFNKTEWKEIVHFSWYHLLAGISVYCVGFVDQLLLAPLDHRGMASLAVYAIAVFIASISSIPGRTMSSTAYPILNAAYLSNDRAHLNELFTRSGINILITGMGMLALIIPNLRNAVNILPRGYEALSSLVIILLIGRFTDLVTGMNYELLSISSHYKFLFRISALMAILLIISCRILIPHFGAYGAAFSASISLMLFNLAKTAFLWKKMQLHPFSYNTLKVVAAATVAACLGYFLPALNNVIIDVIVRSFVIISLYLFMLLLFRPSPDLVVFLQNIKEKRRLF